MKTDPSELFVPENQSVQYFDESMTMLTTPRLRPPPPPPPPPTKAEEEAATKRKQ